MVGKDWVIEIESGMVNHKWIIVGPRWLELVESQEKPIKGALMKPQPFDIVIKALAYWHEYGYINKVRIRNTITDEVVPIEIFG